MKIWFENDILYYDLEYKGIRPQCIQQTGYNIESFLIIGDNVHVKSSKGNYIVHNISNPNITRVTFEE